MAFTVNQLKAASKDWAIAPIEGDTRPGPRLSQVQANTMGHMLAKVAGHPFADEIGKQLEETLRVFRANQDARAAAFSHPVTFVDGSPSEQVLFTIALIKCARFLIKTSDGWGE